MRQQVQRTAGIVVVGLVLVFSPAALGAAEQVPLDRFVDLTLKILTYDMDLKAKAADTLYIGVAFTDGNREVAEDLLQAFFKRQSVKVAGLGFEPIPVPFHDVDAMHEVLDATSPICLVAIGELRSSLDLLSQTAREHRMLSVTSEKDFVGYLSLALVAEGKSVRIYRSDSALEAEGIRLSSVFLQVTQKP